MEGSPVGKKAERVIMAVIMACREGHKKERETSGLIDDDMCKAFPFLKVQSHRSTEITH